MCGIFGYIGDTPLDEPSIKVLVTHSQQRGRDSSGLVTWRGSRYGVYRADFPAAKLIKKVRLGHQHVFFGHSRLITNGHTENQPVSRSNVLVLHNGIIVNHEELWRALGLRRDLSIDTEIIAAIAEDHLAKGGDVDSLGGKILGLCRGVAACAVALPSLGKLVLFSNNGSLYVGELNGGHVFASERFALDQLECRNVEQVFDARIIDIPSTTELAQLKEWSIKRAELINSLTLTGAQERLLEYQEHVLRRCSRCILPETMPFIRFDGDGVCNYCLNYKPRNSPRPISELERLVEPYRRVSGTECIVPFSGGRDSSYALHLIVNELEMKPIAYTYDWGMVTDLGRRNISRMCAELKVENIIVAADIKRKRNHIARNLRAWLKSPHLGMVSILTAGDKHFFAHIEDIKTQTGVSLNLWGINPLEVTHFKAGFLGVPPDFEEERVYSHGAVKQIRYQALRLRAMTKSPGYFNTSMWDTLSGEYYRSFASKSDYFHVFDYSKWDEGLIDRTLDKYEWERSPDTQTTWRIGDGTAAFYNYVYYTMAGFTEHDTFRSNQVREGDLTRSEALKLVAIENQPRFANIKWYLDSLGFEFEPVISTVNAAARLVGTQG